MKRILTIVITVVILGLLGWGGTALYSYYNTPREKLVFKSEKISRGDLRSTISASGTIEPEELINVGAQVNGKIMSFGTDADGKTIDYGSRITAGMVLARIDDVLYDAEVRQAKASKLQAEAAIKSANANIAVAKANLRLAEQNWLRAAATTMPPMPNISPPKPVSVSAKPLSPRRSPSWLLPRPLFSKQNGISTTASSPLPLTV